MDSSQNCIKRTTAQQFQVLIQLLENNSDLARSVPTFGSSKAAADEIWESIAAKLNSYGPQRTAEKWKKVWADLKSRTKAKIGANDKSLHATGGGPYRIQPLSELEQSVDRIVNLSTAAAPSGKTVGYAVKSQELSYNSLEELLEITPPRGTTNVLKTNTQQYTQQPSTTLIGTASERSANDTPLKITPPTSPQRQPSTTMKITPQNSNKTPSTTMTTTPQISNKTQLATTSQQSKRRQSLLGKRKLQSIDRGEQLKLLQQQVQTQEQILNVMNVQAEAAKSVAETAKMQAEAFVMIADATQAIAIAMQDILKYVNRDAVA